MIRLNWDTRRKRFLCISSGKWVFPFWGWWPIPTTNYFDWWTKEFVLGLCKIQFNRLFSSFLFDLHVLCLCESPPLSSLSLPSSSSSVCMGHHNPVSFLIISNASFPSLYLCHLLVSHPRSFVQSQLPAPTPPGCPAYSFSLTKYCITSRAPEAPSNENHLLPNNSYPSVSECLVQYCSLNIYHLIVYPGNSVKLEALSSFCRLEKV